MKKNSYRMISYVMLICMLCSLITPSFTVFAQEELIYDELEGQICDDQEESAYDEWEDAVDDGTSARIFETTVEEAGPDCIMLGFYGTYYVDAANAINRINEIRLEACKAGNIANPNDTSKNLTEADYVPIKWSAELEKIARIRAMESGLARQVLGSGHSRLNGEKIWFSLDGTQSYGEILAYNNTAGNYISSINQWYGEKSLYESTREDNSSTGHYVQMIDPQNKYIGLGDFYTSAIGYRNTLAGEFNKYKSSFTETPIEENDTNIYQKIEVKKSYISDYYFTGNNSMEIGDLQTLIPMATVIGTKSASAAAKLYVLDDISYTSSDEKVATVTADGIVSAKGAGTVTIKAFVDAEAIISYEIEVTDPNATPTATASATPTATASAEASATPTATASAEASATPTATASAEASATPTATASATVSTSPEATASATPLETEKPTVIPGEEPTEEPTALPTTGPVVESIRNCDILLDANKIVYGSDLPIVTVKNLSTGRTLKEDVDYTLRYVNAQNKGKAAVYVSGIGSYTGIVKMPFNILAADIHGAEIIHVESEGCVYRKSGATPAIEMVGPDGATLIQGKDYKIAYKYNKKVGDMASVIVVGCGNYKGKVTFENVFEVEEADLNAATIVVNDIVEGKKPSVTVYDAYGKKISKGKDYTLNIEYAEDGKSGTVQIYTGSNGYYMDRTLDPVEFNIIPKAEKAKIITSAKLEKKRIPQNALSYTGNEIVLKPEYVKVKAGKTVLRPGIDYEVIECINNVDKGTAIAIIETKDGSGFYGVRAITYKITSPSK